MSREWRRIRDQWEKARITDAQFISRSEAIGVHYGALAREMVRRDFGEAWRSLATSKLWFDLVHDRGEIIDLSRTNSWRRGKLTMQSTALTRFQALAQSCLTARLTNFLVLFGWRPSPGGRTEVNRGGRWPLFLWLPAVGGNPLPEKNR